MSTAFDDFIRPMQRRFTVPQGLLVEEYLSDLAEALEDFTPYQRASAAAWFRDNRENRTFPTVAECRKACATVPRSPTDARRPSSVPTSADRAAEEREESAQRRLGCRLARCEMGRQADREGWLVPLIEFAGKHNRLPSGFEIERVKAIARRTEDALHANSGKPLYASLCNWRKIMLERAHREVFEDYREVEAEDRQAWVRERFEREDPGHSAIAAELAARKARREAEEAAQEARRAAREAAE